MLFSKEHRPKVRPPFQPTLYVRFTTAATRSLTLLLIANFPQIKEENPDITFGQIGKKLGEMWRALDDKEKQAYKDRKE